MHIKDIKNKLKVLKKRAQGSVGTAIKVLTSVVLGASILVGGYALTNEVVLPNTTEKVESMFAYSADADANAGGSGTVEPTPSPSMTFRVDVIDYSTYESFGSLSYSYEEGMLWSEWIASSYNTVHHSYGDKIIKLDNNDVLLAEMGIMYEVEPGWDEFVAGNVAVENTNYYVVCSEYSTINKLLAPEELEAPYNNTDSEVTCWIGEGGRDLVASVPYRSGMTWGDWIDEGFLPGEYSYTSEGYIMYDGQLVYNVADYSEVTREDVINNISRYQFVPYTSWDITKQFIILGFVK